MESTALISKPSISSSATPGAEALISLPLYLFDHFQRFTHGTGPDAGDQCAAIHTDDPSLLPGRRMAQQWLLLQQFSGRIAIPLPGYQNQLRFIGQQRLCRDGAVVFKVCRVDRSRQLYQCIPRRPRAGLGGAGSGTSQPARC